MSLADATAAIAPLGRPLAVLVGAPPAADVALRDALESAGHRVRRVAGLADLGLLAEEEPIAVVVVDAEALVEADRRDDAWAPLLGVGAEVFALHREDDDVAALWHSFRRGAVPWMLGRTTCLPGLAPAGSFGGELALDALHEELVGRHIEACRLLSSLREPEVLAEVVEILVSAGAASLQRLRNRSRYPVPTELLVQHLPTHVGTLEGTDFALWWTMVEAAAFRASGLRLPLPGMDLASRPFATVFGAFHATSTIVRFTARRQWRQPADLLVDLADAE